MKLILKMKISNTLLKTQRKMYDLLLHLLEIYTILIYNTFNNKL